MSAKHFDVVVLGGGPAGIGAALGAARAGARAGLVERHPMPGGMGTAALVNNFCNAHKTHRNSRLIIGGVFGELRSRLIARDAIFGTDLSPASWMEPYNPDVFVEEIIGLLQGAGVTGYFNRTIEDAGFEKPAKLVLDDGTVLTAETLVDASGDAALAQRAGIPFNFGRAGDHAVMPLTYCYSVGPIDIERVREKMPYAIRRDVTTGVEYVFVEEHPEVVGWVKAARESGELTIPRKHIVSITSIPGNLRYGTVNFGRVFCTDPTDPAKLALATAEGLKQVHEAMAFFRKYLPGFEKVELGQLARQIGVRESRQIIGRYTLTGEDVVGGRQFEDVIAQCCYSIDIHEPGSDQTTITQVGGPGHYDIPLRCLIPASGVEQLIVAGRCISATHEAMSSLRVAPSVMAIGQAAGVTAALAAKGRTAVGEVPYAKVREVLLAQQAILD